MAQPNPPLPLTREEIFEARASKKEVTFFRELREMKVVFRKCTLKKYQHCISNMKTHTANFITWTRMPSPALRPPPSPHPTHTGRTMAWDTAAHTAWTTQPRLHGYFSLHLLDGSTSLPKTVHHGGRPWLMDWTQIVGFCLYTCGVQILGQNISAHSDVLYEVAWSNLCTCGMQL